MGKANPKTTTTGKGLQRKKKEDEEILEEPGLDLDQNVDGRHGNKSKQRSKSV